MDVIPVTAGILLLLLALVDTIATTVGFAGGGPLTRRIANGTWKLFLTFHQRERRGSFRLLRAAGPVILFLTVHVWILLIFCGYALLFASDPDAVVSGSSGKPADLAERLYYTGFTIFTLGTGDFVPGSDVWRLVSVAATLNGLFLVTLSITYLLPVVSAVAEKYRLAGFISDLGDTPQKIVTRAWDGESFDSLRTPLSSIVAMLELHSQKHLAYPVLHYFPSADRRTNFASRLGVLHEAVLVMNRGVDEKARLTGSVGDAVEDAIDGFLVLMERFDNDEPAEPPRLPEWGEVRAAGIPVLSVSELRALARPLAERRGLLRAVVRDAGRDWNADVLVGEGGEPDGGEGAAEIESGGNP